MHTGASRHRRRDCPHSARTAPDAPAPSRRRPACASSARTWRRSDRRTMQPQSTGAVRDGGSASAGRAASGATLASDVISTKRSSSPSAASASSHSVRAIQLDARRRAARRSVPRCAASRARAARRRALRARWPVDAGAHLSAGAGNSAQVARNTDSARVPGMMPPDLLGRERQDRRQPAHHGFGDPVHRRLRRAARRGRSPASCTGDP